MVLGERVKAHICNFSRPNVSPVQCLAANEALDLLAVGVNAGCVSLWTLSEPQTLVRILTGSVENELRKLLWIEDDSGWRLFSVCLSGFILDWDWKSGGKPVSETSANGAAIWDCAWSPNTKRLYSACDNGSVRIHNIDDFERPAYHSALQTFKRRCLSVCVSLDGDYVAAGTDESTIFVWNTKSQENTGKINLDAELKAVGVWALEPLSNLQFACGLSTGYVEIYDFLTATQICAFNLMHDSVLCFTRMPSVGGSNEILFASGMEGKLTTLTKPPDGDEWNEGSHQRPHVHDILCLTNANDKIYAGSNDARVSVNLAHTLKRTHFLSPLYALPTQTRIVAGHPYVLDWDHNHFRIWRQQLRKEILEELLFDFKLKNTHTLTSASLSADGNYIAVSDQIKARIWCVQYNEVKELELPIVKGCQTVAFHNQRNELLMGFKSCAKVLDLDSGEQKGSTVTYDKSSKTIWVEDYICVFSEKKAILYKDANAVFTAPSYPQTPVTATMHENLFAIGYASGHVRVFDLKTRLLISWSKENERRFEFTRLMSRIKTAMTKLSFNGNGKGLLLGNPDWVTVMSLEKPLPSATIELPKHTKKKRKSIAEVTKSPTFAKQEEPLNELYLNYKQPHLADLTVVQDNEVILTKVNWMEVLKLLPKPVWRHKYGSS